MGSIVAWQDRQNYAHSKPYGRQSFRIGFTKKTKVQSCKASGELGGGTRQIRDFEQAACSCVPSAWVSITCRSFEKMRKQCVGNIIRQKCQENGIRSDKTLLMLLRTYVDNPSFDTGEYSPSAVLVPTMLIVVACIYQD